MGYIYIYTLQACVNSGCARYRYSLCSSDTKKTIREMFLFSLITLLTAADKARACDRSLQPFVLYS